MLQEKQHSNDFDSLETRLDRPGFHLIEASAGSGKTWCVSFIAARLIAEYGVAPEHILITTFTRAAAAEMAERITRLMRNMVAALEALQQGTKADSEVLENPVYKWAAHLSDPQSPYQRLQQSIHHKQAPLTGTNDAVFQALMRRYALHTGTTLDEPRLANEADFLPTALRRFWWQEYERLSPPVRRLYLRTMPDTKKLARSVRIEYLYDTHLAHHEPLAEARASLLRRSDELIAQAAVDSTIYPVTDMRDTIKKNSQNKIFRDFQRLEQLSRDGLLPVLEADDLKSSLLNAVRKESKGAMSEFVDQSSFLGLLGKWQEAKKRYFDSLGYAALKTVREELAVAVRQQGNWSYDSIREDLYHHLENHPDSPLNGCFQAVIVDEFQDTDRRQWEVIKKLLSHSGCGYLVGDPKQAIYRFRKADLNTYFIAADHCQRHFDLPCNWRSTTPVVAAINAFFDTDNSFRHHKIHFRAARAASKKDSGKAIFIRPHTPCELTPEERSHFIVQRVKEALKDDYSPADIMIIVNKHHQAAQVSRALQRANIQALRKKIDADTKERLCNRMHWLLSCLDEDTAVSSQRLLAFGVVGLPPNAWQSTVVKWDAVLQDLRRLWPWQGPLGIWHALCRQTPLLSCWDDKSQSGEYRVMASILVPFQKLWYGQRSFDYWPALYTQWLKALDRAEPTVGTKEGYVHLTTIFAAKGLESKAVIYPFLSDLISPRRKNILPLLSSESGGFTLDLQADLSPRSNYRNLLTKEDEQEQQRLLYVAMTRAIERLEVFLEPQGEKWLQEQRRVDNLDALRRELASWEWLDLVPSPTEQCQSAKTPQPRLYRAEYSAQRGISSFSHLTEDNVERDPLMHDWGEPEHDGQTELLLPAGRKSGSALHRALEQLLTDPSLKKRFIAGQEEKWRDRMLVENGVPLAASEEFEALLKGVLQQPLEALSGSSLGDLRGDSLCTEMPFSLQIKAPLECRTLNQLGSDHQATWHLSSLPEKQAPAGIFNGFIDLVARHENRYWIVDYKSNALPGYSTKTLQKAMENHDYGWQCSFYLLALHRYLNRVMKDYHWQYHLGGAVYIFARGLAGNDKHGILTLNHDMEWIEKLHHAI